MKKFLSISLALVLSLSALTGCGDEPVVETVPATEDTKEEAPVASDEPAEVEEAVEITMWAFPTFSNTGKATGVYEQELADTYMAENPSVTVNIEMIDFTNGPEKLINSVQGGTNPDILFDAPGRIIDYGMSGYLVPLDDMVEELKSDIVSEGLLGACADIEGNYWMYPTSAAPFVMAVSTTALEEAGLLDMAPLDGERTWTTEEFIELSKAMAEKGYKGVQTYCGSAGGDQGTRSFVTNLTGAAIMNDERTEYTMSNEEGIEALQMINDGIEEGWMERNTAGDANAALGHFTTPGAEPFWAVNLWSPGLDALRAPELESAGIEAVAVNMPSKSGTPELEYLVNGYCIFDNEDDAKIQASKDFIAWLSDDEVVGKANVIATNCFPVRTSFGDLYEGNEEMEFYSSITKYYGGYYNTVPGFADMRPFWWGSLQAMLTGDMTPEEAAMNFDEKANATLVK